MPPSPHDHRRDTDDLTPSKRVRALVSFCGIWLIGTGFTLLFAHHKQNPFNAFTSKIPLVGVPFVIALYAAVLASAWASLPRFKSELIDDSIRNSVTVVGGVFAPHVLSFLFGLLQ